MTTAQIELNLSPDWQRCRHSGFTSLCGPGGAITFYCDQCEQHIISYLPEQPEALGYVSAYYKHWQEEFPDRYTINKTTKQTP